MPLQGLYLNFVVCYIWRINDTRSKSITSEVAVADPGSGRGGALTFFPRFCRRNEVSQYCPGSALGPWKLLHF